MAKVDFRKTLRAIATAVQNQNLERLLGAVKLNGGTVLPRAQEVATATGRAKRVRLFGIRVNLRDIAGKVGVGTGAMLRDVTRKANQKIGRVSFKIIPSPEMRMRWFAFQAGTKHQPPRPTSGISDTLMESATAQIAEDARNQFVKKLQGRPRA